MVRVQVRQYHRVRRQPLGPQEGAEGAVFLAGIEHIDPVLIPEHRGVGVAGVDGVLMRFAKCCSPIPGDPIVGYISRGQGITVHRADCPNVPNMEPERLISVHWEGEEEKPYAAGIFIIADNVRGTLAPVAQALADAEINIDELNVKSTVEGRSHMRLKVEVRNATQLYDIIERIRKLPNILEVVRDREDIDAPNP